MPILHTENILADYPAFEVRKARKSNEGVVRVHHNDEFSLNVPTRSDRDSYHKFSFFSISGYALQFANCPFDAHERADKFGQKKFVVTGWGPMITSHEQDKKTLVGLVFGDTIQFEGKLFTLEPDADNNIRLEDIG